MKTTQMSLRPRLFCALLAMLFFAGCASGINRKKSYFFQSNQGFGFYGDADGDGDGDGNGDGDGDGDGDGSEFSAPPAPFALPIGPFEVARFPHLAPHRGKVLLGRNGLQVIVAGEQSSWTPVTATSLTSLTSPTSPAPNGTLVPIILAVFEARGDAGKRTYVRNPALDGVAMRVECAARCAPGLAVRLEGLQEASPEAGVTGLSLRLVAGPEAVKKTLAQVNVLVGGPGPGILIESLPAEGSSGPVSLTFEPQTSPGSLLAVPESDLVDGGNPKRLSYVQVESAGGQFMILPAPTTAVAVTNKKLRVTHGLHGAVQGANLGANQGSNPTAHLIPLRCWIFIGDQAVQNGFHLALEQELGAPFAGQDLDFSEALTHREPLAPPSAESWLANDSGDPLLLLSMARRPIVRIPLEIDSPDETPIPFVLRLGGVQVAEKFQKIARSKLKVKPEILEQVSFYGVQTAPAQIPDMVAVAPLGAQRELRKLMMRLVSGEGGVSVGAGITRVVQWPVRMELPHGVYEALFFSRAKGLVCRVPFDVSRRRDLGSIPPVACGPAQRGAQPSRLTVIPDIAVTPWTNPFSIVRNHRLGIEFKVFPAPDKGTVAILEGLGHNDLDHTEASRQVVPVGHRTILLPCPVDSGLLENLRATPLASPDTTFVVPVRGCGPEWQRDSWPVVEQMRGMGLNGGAMIFPAEQNQREQNQIGMQGLTALDVAFPIEAIAPTASSPTGNAGELPSALPVFGRGGTYLAMGPVRMLAPTRGELTVRIGRALAGTRYLDPPWTLRHLRVVSGGAVLSEAMVDPGRNEYKMSFPVAVSSARKQNATTIRVELTGRLQGVMAATLDSYDDFIVGETQLLDVK